MRFFDRWLKQEKTPSPDMVRQQPTPSEVATPDIEPLDVGGDPWTVYVFASREDAEEHARVCAEKSQDEMTKTREFDVRSPDALYPFFLSPPLAHIYSGAWFSVLRDVWGGTETNVVHQLYLTSGRNIQSLSEYTEKTVVSEKITHLAPGELPVSAFYPAKHFQVAIDPGLAAWNYATGLRFKVTQNHDSPCRAPSKHFSDHLKDRFSESQLSLSA